MAGTNSPIQRPAARILLIDQDDTVLLFKWDPPGIWITPGGALDTGESYERAALRELWEETGLDGVELGPCVWTRRHIGRGGDQFYESIERFFVVRTQRFNVVPAAFDAFEAETMRQHHWWSLSEIDAAAGSETFAPRRLGALLPPIIRGEIPPLPIDTGS